MVNYVPPNHHKEVLMDHVVAMDQVPPEEVPELHEEFDRVAGWEAYDVLSTRLQRVRRRCTIALQNPELLEMDVNGVRPIRLRRKIPQGPDLSRALLRLMV